MRNTSLAVLMALLLQPVPAGAWGFAAHRLIMARTIDALPDPIRPFFEAHRAFLVEHSVDPDLWRRAGFADESSRHFLNLDAYGTDPFGDLPREYGAAVAKYGPEALARNGVLPWRTGEMAGRLRRAFQQQQRGGRYAPDDIQFFSAVIAHYVSDGHVPFHAVLNYDGQFTKQTGIHARFEAELFDRYAERLTVRPGPLKAVAEPSQLMFDALLESFRLVEPVLAADREAIGSRDAYDDRYYEVFGGRVVPLLERRIGDAVTAAASVIASAWEQAGKPALPVNPPRRVEKRGSRR